MDLTQQAKTQIDQLKAQGLDLATIQAIVQSTYGDTTPLGLKRWKADDKPQMADFNRDNEILDREIRNIQEELAHKANTNTPEIYELEPRDGFFFPEGGSNVLCKTQENIVILSANISKDVNESIGNQEVIAQLPYGFYPAKLIQTAGMLYNPRISPPILPGIVSISNKGEIVVIHHVQEPYYRVHFSCAFPAQ